MGIFRALPFFRELSPKVKNPKMKIPSSDFCVSATKSLKSPHFYSVELQND